MTDQERDPEATGPGAPRTGETRRRPTRPGAADDANGDGELEAEPSEPEERPRT